MDKERSLSYLKAQSNSKGIRIFHSIKNKIAYTEIKEKNNQLVVQLKIFDSKYHQQFYEYKWHQLFAFLLVINLLKYVTNDNLFAILSISIPAIIILMLGFIQLTKRGKSFRRFHAAEHMLIDSFLNQDVIISADSKLSDIIPNIDKIQESKQVNKNCGSTYFFIVSILAFVLSLSQAITKNFIITIFVCILTFFLMKFNTSKIINFQKVLLLTPTNKELVIAQICLYYFLENEMYNKIKTEKIIIQNIDYNAFSLDEFIF